MRRTRIYFLFCISVLSLVLCFWYVTTPVVLDSRPTRQEVFLQYETSSSLVERTLHVEDWDEGDPCEDSPAKEYLLNQLDGRMLCHSFLSSRSYTSQFPIFNRRLSVNPKLIITPTSVEDIALGLKLAKKLNLTVTVRDGGHNPAGFSLNEGGLVIDMAFLRKVEFVSESSDPVWKNYEDDFIVAQGGAVWSDVHTVLKRRHPLSIVGGGCPSVGVVGLALGGGIGWSSRHRGLVSDNMLAVKLVFPNGTLAVIEEEANPELMWALRGAGGSNFGVIVEVVLRTFPAQHRYLAGQFAIMRHPSDAEDIVNLYGSQILNRELDHRLTIDLFFSMDLQSSGPPSIELGFGLLFDGPVEDGLIILKPFLEALAGQLNVADACKIYKKLCETSEGSSTAVKLAMEWLRGGGPFLQNHTFLTWASVFGIAHADVHWTNGVFAEWTPSMTEQLLKSFKSSGISHLPIGIKGTLHATFEQLRGAIGIGPSLWKHKTAAGLVSLQTFLEANKEVKEDRTGQYTLLQKQMKIWVDHVYRRLRNSFTGAYSNYAYLEMANWEDQYYGLEAYNKLIEIKAKIPDSGVFNGDQRIGKVKLDPNQVEFVWSSKVAEHQLDRDSFEAESSLLCPDWLVDHALMATPSDLVVSTPIQDSKAESNLHNIRNQLMKTVLFLGGSDGIGFSAVLNFLALGVNVITTSRTIKKCRETEAKIHKLFQQEQISNSASLGSLFCLSLQLDDLESIEQFKSNLKTLLRTQKLNIIVLNAGNNGKGGIASNAGGLSKALLVNHLGHFYLTLLVLQDELIHPAGRVVIQCSGAAMSAKEEQILSLLEEGQEQVALNATTTEDQGSFFGSPEFLTYAAGKALSVMFALEFHRRLQYSEKLKDLRVFVTIPPGTAQTPLTQEYLQSQSIKEELLTMSVLISTAEAALPCVYASLEKLDQFNVVFVEQNFTRELEWEYKQQPLGVQLVTGCQASSVAARFRFVDWLKIGTTCRIWNWGVQTLNRLRDNSLHVEEAPLKELELNNCTP